MYKDIFLKPKKFITEYKYVILPVLITAVLLAIVLSDRKTITVVVDGNETKLVTYRKTVETALKDNGIYIGSKDKVTPSPNDKLYDKSTIILKRAANIRINVDGETIDVLSAEDTVDSMLKAEGIVLNADDRVVPDRLSDLSPGMEVDIIRVEYKTVTENKSLSFKEIVKADSKLANTKRNVIQEGKGGEAKVTYSVTYENGKEVSRTMVKEEVIKEPMNRIIVQGTYPSMPVSSRGEVLPYSKTFKAKATAYWAVRGVGKTYTASGRKAVRNPDGYSTIAVDPGLIPYGTKLFVEGYGFATAADTGTGIKGETIDVFFDTYKEACSWGLKYVNVYILK